MANRAQRRADRVWWAAACLLVAVSIGERSPVERPRLTTVSSARVQRRNAERLLDRGELGEAIALATNAAERAPDDAEAWVSLGAMHSKAGHAREARATYVAFLERAGAMDVCGQGAQLLHALAEPAGEGAVTVYGLSDR